MVRQEKKGYSPPPLLISRERHRGTYSKYPRAPGKLRVVPLCKEKDHREKGQVHDGNGTGKVELDSSTKPCPLLSLDTEEGKEKSLRGIIFCQKEN